MINFFKNIGLRIVSFFMMLLLLSILIGTINFIGSLFSNESSPKKEIKKEIKKMLAFYIQYCRQNQKKYSLPNQ